MKVWTWDLSALDASSRSDQEVIQRAAQLIQDTKPQIPLIKGGLGWIHMLYWISEGPVSYGLDAKGQLLETHKCQRRPKKEDRHLTQQRKSYCYLKKHPLAGIAISSAGMVDPDKEKSLCRPTNSQLCRHPIQKEIVEETFRSPLRDWKWCQSAGLAEVTTGHACAFDNAVCRTIKQDRRLAFLLSMARFFMVLAPACEVGYLHLPDAPFRI